MQPTMQRIPTAARNMQLSALLSRNGIVSRMRDGRLEAFQGATISRDGQIIPIHEWVEIQDWSMPKIMRWLGY